MIKLIIDEGVKIPDYKKQKDSGFDVSAMSIVSIHKGNIKIDSDKVEVINENFKKYNVVGIRAFERIVFDTGLTVGDLSDNIELQVRPRSGLTMEKGLTVLNSPGTIDNGYRGRIRVVIYNSTPYVVSVSHAERIAQIVPSYLVSDEEKTIKKIEIGTTTDRGDSGFGSTGKM